MTLSDLERRLPLWQKIEAYYKERLITLRGQNDSIMPEAQRGPLLGQIQEVKSILALGEERPNIE